MFFIQVIKIANAGMSNSKSSISLPYIEVLSIRFLSEMLHDPLVNINENYSTMGERFYSVVVTEIN